MWRPAVSRGPRHPQSRPLQLLTRAHIQRICSHAWRTHSARAVPACSAASRPTGSQAHTTPCMASSPHSQAHPLGLYKLHGGAPCQGLAHVCFGWQAPRLTSRAPPTHPTHPASRSPTRDFRMVVLAARPPTRSPATTATHLRLAPQVSSQYFWSGNPWDMVSRKYVADTINVAGLPSGNVTQNDVIAVSAMEATGVARRWQCHSQEGGFAAGSWRPPATRLLAHSPPR